MARRRLPICFLGLALLSAASVVHAAPTTEPVKLPTYAATVHKRSIEIIDRLARDGDADAAQKAADGLLDEVILYTPDNAPVAFRDAVFARRFANQLGQLPKEQRIDDLKYLSEHDTLAQTLVFLIPPDAKDVPGIYGMLDTLRAKYPNQLEKYANLVAAICVVRHEPWTQHVNENPVDAPDAVAMFEFYVRHEQQMFFGLRDVPAELLEHVVDIAASIDEMEWAFNKYAGDKDVGRRFFDIKYDSQSLKFGAVKIVDTKGYNLPNILKWGGICADQAYFATTVGKAIGVPTAVVGGASGRGAHAWVGFLQVKKNVAVWNFDSGRYEDFQCVRGSVRDPSSGKGEPDNFVGLLGELTGTHPGDRQACIALTDAAARLEQFVHDKTTVQVTAPADVAEKSTREKPRDVNTDAVLSLAELAIRQSAGYAPSWFAVRDLASDKDMSIPDKNKWADVLMRLGAKKYPDFTLDVLTPMVLSIDEPNAQDALWKVLLPKFKDRFDLCANIRAHEADLWEGVNQPDKAGEIYVDIIKNYADNGPFVFAALTGAERLLNATHRPERVPLLYEQAWKGTNKPDPINNFSIQSNWYRIGKMYADKLADAGLADQSQVVLRKIAPCLGPAAAVQ